MAGGWRQWRLILNLEHARTQIIVLGMLAFANPGIYNANIAAPFRNNSSPVAHPFVASAVLYAVFGFTSFLSGPITHLVSPRASLFIGCSAYPIYTLIILAGEYTHNEESGNVAAGLILGFGAAIFWTEQGSLTLGYATPQNLALYLAIFWCVFSLGGVAGCLIKFAPISGLAQGLINTAAMVSLTSLSLPLLADPSTVWREDGTIVGAQGKQRSGDFKEEMNRVLKAPIMPEIILMTLFFVGSNWYYTWQFSFLNDKLFVDNMATTTQCLYWLAQAASGFVLAPILDRDELGVQKRACWGLFIFASSCAVCWIYSVIVQYRFHGGVDKDWQQTEPPISRWSVEAIAPATLLVCFGLADAFYQIYAYWFLGQLCLGFLRPAATLVGYYKGTQSIGNATAWVIDIPLSVTYRLQLWVCIAHFLLNLPLALVAALRLDVAVKRERNYIVRDESSLSILYM